MVQTLKRDKAKYLCKLLGWNEDSDFWAILVLKKDRIEYLIDFIEKLKEQS